MDRAMIKIDSLNTIGECLEQLALAEEGLIAIDGQLLKHDADQAWRKRAENARRTIGQKKRIITARLSVLRHQEKEHNRQMHHTRDSYLIAELREIVTPSSFLRCVHRAETKLEAASE